MTESLAAFWIQPLILPATEVESPQGASNYHR